MKETKEITGDVQAIKKDRKAVEIENIWYSSQFKLIPDNIEKFDNVKVIYSQNKGFNNIVSIEKIVAENLKPNPEAWKKSFKDKENHVVQDNRKDQIAGMLSSYVKDIVVAVIQSSQSHDELKTVTELATTNLINAYNKIKQSI